MTTLEQVERNRASQRKYYLLNKEKIKAYNKANKTRIQNSCKVYYEANKEKIKAKQLQLKYGITIEEYNQLLINQNYSCKICFKNKEELEEALCVDHCHTTGKVRGLLCHSCNMGLGKFKDNKQLLLNAIEYIK